MFTILENFSCGKRFLRILSLGNRYSLCLLTWTFLMTVFAFLPYLTNPQNVQKINRTVAGSTYSQSLKSPEFMQWILVRIFVQAYLIRYLNKLIFKIHLDIYNTDSPLFGPLARLLCCRCQSQKATTAALDKVPRIDPSRTIRPHNHHLQRHILPWREKLRPSVPIAIV